MGYTLFSPTYKNLSWVEWVCLVLLIIGLIISLSAGSAVIYYILAFLAGLFFGRLWYRTRKDEQFKYLMMITFFMIGFIIGNYLTRYGDPIITMLVYLLGIVISYSLHSKGHVHSTDY